PEEILIRIQIANRGLEAAPLHLLPTIWFRNTWADGLDARRPRLRALDNTSIELNHQYYDRRWLYCDESPELLFTENETNIQRLYGTENDTPYVKDGINDYIVHGARGAVNPEQMGTKAAAHYPLTLSPGETVTVRLRFTNREMPSPGDAFGPDFDQTFLARQREADEFYATVTPEGLSPDARNVMRQALAGLLWSKRSHAYEVSGCLKGYPSVPPPPPERLQGRNHDWMHLYNVDVIVIAHLGKRYRAKSGGDVSGKREGTGSLQIAAIQAAVK